MRYKAKFINRVIYLIIFIWSSIVFGAILLNVKNNYGYANSLVKTEAIVSVKKDLAYRSWGASHGGVYVPITKSTPPNPYLSHIKNRDVYTTAGQHLTLMNPAYILSQMMHDYTKLYGIKGHITSRVLMNPKNKPDAWEEKVLKEAEITRKSYSTKEDMGGEEYFRYLRPLVTKKSCLKCHAFQGYKEGDIRGGVSVSIPMKPYYDEAFKHSLEETAALLFIYLLGLGVIFYGKKRAKELLEEKIKDYEQHIFSLVNIIEKRDSYTAGHSKRVAKYSVLIAEQMGYNKDKLDDLYRACMLHDIGKISTPDSILLKPGRLTPLEYEIIKEHVVVSYELLNGVDIYKDIAEIVRHHHEHYDGSGYPQGLKGDEIPMLSQIMTVADSFDAMTTNRIYKTRKDVSVALSEMQRLAGKQFHSEVVRAALVALKDISVEMEISQQPKSKIEKERFSYFYKDQVTDVYNKDYLEFVLAYNHTDEFNMRCLSAVSLHNFNQYNKKYGWNEGDKLLKKFAQVLVNINKSELVFRVFGDSFIVLNSEHFDLSKHLDVLNAILEGSGVSISIKHSDMKTEDIKMLSDIEALIRRKG